MPLMLNLHQLTSVTSGNKGTKSPYSEKGQALNYVLPLQQAPNSFQEIGLPLQTHLLVNSLCKITRKFIVLELITDQV